MALRSPFWSSNQRKQRAADNKPPMKQGEPDKVAVTLLQQALINTGHAPTIKADGLFGPKTAGGVRDVETKFNMDKDAGVAGRQVIGILDILLQGGRLGADLARADTGLARQKVQAAILALNNFRVSLIVAMPPNPLTVAALRTHFRLFLASPTIGVGRQVTTADIDAILARYNQLIGLLAPATSRFQTGVPVNGIFTAAEAPLGGPVRFGPAFTNVDSHFGDRIGPNSRAAVLIHEGVHVFDALSGDDNLTHISEFDEPRYSQQPADQSLHNPSSFAGFAAHIHNNGDPVPRFGLGPGARGL
jgi:peptidoglycan hydrolase-like protein with peptidoglycan-binding domain